MQNLIGEGSKISLSDYQAALTEQEKSLRCWATCLRSKT